MEHKTKNSSLLSKWKNREEKVSVAPIVPKVPEGTTIPLSSGQQRIWFLQQLYPDNPFYNYSEALLFEGNLNVDFLKKSLDQLFTENEILRSYYPIVDGRPILKISDNIPDIHEFDFSALPEAEAEKKIAIKMRAQSATIYDLSKPALLNVSVLKKDAERHILFLTMHHIIIDEWSIGIIKNQLSSNYRKLSKGIVLEPYDNGVKYSDYAHWQRNKGIDQAQLDYWKGKLSNDIPILNLQTDYNRAVRPRFRGKQYGKELTSELSSRIFDSSKTLETTPFIYLLSVYYILLHKHSGQNDILVGTPISNRSVKSLESVLGFFIDTVVLRNEIDIARPFSEFIKSVKKNTLEAFSNKDVPFDALVKELKVERSLAINPFFQVMFLYHAEEKVPFFGDNMQLSQQTEFDTEVSKFDLTLSISEIDGGLFLTFEYDTDLFEESTIARLLEHYQILLEGILDNSDTSIAELPMLTEKEKFFFLEKQVPKKNHFSSYKAIHHVIEDVCKTFAQNTAVSFKGKSITYETLNKEAQRLAFAIREKSKRHHAIVGLCMDRSIDMVIGLLAILKAGCAYLPLDPKYPSARLDFILKDAECDVLVTHSSLEKLFEDSQKELVLVDKVLQQDISEDVELPEVEAEDLAYVIYTSGSTGKPKGVPISHDNIINSTAGRLNFYPDNPDTFLLMSSISFDSSKAGIFWTLCTGGNLVIAEDRIEQDIFKLEGLIENQKISHTLMLPSLYKLLLEHGTLSKLDSLKSVIVAGEACTPSLVDAHFKKLPSANLYNEYGPTEATVWCTAHHIGKNDNSGVVPIGKPVANATIYLLDERLKFVPYGAVGEIYIGGPGLSDGYINRPELLEKAFLMNPYGDTSKERIYKTGDLGRFRSDGAIEFLGRADHQVKIRGFRIELDEVEKAIAGHTTVTDVIALVEASEPIDNTMDIDDFSDTATVVKYLKQHLSSDELNEILTSIKFLKSEEEKVLIQK